jgi:hypothetical protein
MQELVEYLGLGYRFKCNISGGRMESVGGARHSRSIIDEICVGSIQSDHIALFKGIVPRLGCSA